MSVREHITGVGHVGIPTNDLEGTIAYYEKLGFECEGIYPNGEDRCTFLHLNNLTLEVWTMDQPARSIISHLTSPTSTRRSRKPRSWG